jgi:Protein of unknown function (DUF2868)
MDERTALAVTAVRAVETADRARTSWTDTDRAWASRAAAEVVGADAAPAQFVGRRARLALERLAARGHAVARLAAAWRWRGWVGAAVVVVAFIAGAAADALGGARQVNVLYSPALPLVGWNLAVYCVLAAGFVLRYGEPSAPGPLRRAVAWLAGVARRAPGAAAAGDDPAARALATFATDWTSRATPLYAARAARILHAAAAALALGVVAGLYVRGLVFEYRATWESTFLDAPTVRAVLAAAYWPGARVLGVAVPDAAEIATIRAPGSENAAPWLHLMSATLATLVILPRLALAAGVALVERHRAAHLADDLADPYFARLLRGFRPGTAQVRVVPYSYAAEPAALATLEAVLARALGGNVALAVATPVAYGDEESAARALDADARTPVIALFNATATPEPEAHGRFLSALATHARPLVVVVDEAALSARWGDDAGKRDERRALWRDVAASQRVAPVFVDLNAPDADAADAALEAALDGSPA